MSYSSSELKKWVFKGLFCLGAVSWGILAGVSAASAQTENQKAAGSYEVRVFDGPGFTGAAQSLTLEEGSSYAFFERLSDAQISSVRSLKAGASVGVVLFPLPFFVSRDTSCAPTLGSDENPELIWTGATADFLPDKAAKLGGDEIEDAGAAGYASAILYRRDVGPPPGALLMKRRRSYGKGCGNILRSLNFDRRFIPMDFHSSLSDGAQSLARGCLNLQAARIAGKEGADPVQLADMLRSDRIAFLQPSDLDRRFAQQQRRFRAVLYDADNCQGESVTLDGSGAAPATGGLASRSANRRDLLLSNLLFRDRVRSLRVESMDGKSKRIAQAQSKPSAAPLTAPSTARKVEAPAAASNAAQSAAASPSPPLSPLPRDAKASAAAKPKAAGDVAQSATAPETKSLSPVTQSETLKLGAAAAAPMAAAAVPGGAAKADAKPQVGQTQTGQPQTRQPQSELPTAKLEPMTGLPAPPKAPAAEQALAEKSIAEPVPRSIQAVQPSPAAAPSARKTTASNAKPVVNATSVQEQEAAPRPQPQKLDPARSQPAQVPSRTSAASKAEAAERPPELQSSKLAQAQPESAESAPPVSGNQVFTFPVYDVYRLNYCLTTKGGCGEPAASKWCEMKGFKRAVAWQKDNNIGGIFPTFLLGDERICAQYKCDGFAEITCGN